MQCPMLNDGTAAFLLDYCARRLDPAQSAVLESHLKICDSCRELVARQRVVWESLEAWEDIEISQGFNRNLYARVDAERQRSGMRRWADMILERYATLSLRPALAMGALCATLAIALLIQPYANHLGTVQEPQAKVDRVDVEQVERTLQDIDMLKHLDSAPTQESNPSSSM